MAQNRICYDDPGFVAHLPAARPWVQRSVPIIFIHHWSRSGAVMRIERLIIGLLTVLIGVAFVFSNIPSLVLLGVSFVFAGLFLMLAALVSLFFLSSGRRAAGHRMPILNPVSVRAGEAGPARETGHPMQDERPIDEVVAAIIVEAQLPHRLGQLAWASVVDAAEGVCSLLRTPDALETLAGLGDEDQGQPAAEAAAPPDAVIAGIVANAQLPPQVRQLARALIVEQARAICTVLQEAERRAR
jgi:hypothetical protein